MEKPPLRPIVFSGPMVLALLAGEKTQTRRMVKEGAVRCSYGEPGGRLWVRERWRALGHAGERLVVEYAADGAIAEVDVPWHGAVGERAVSPLFLPRAAARLHLEVVAVRRERLQDITEADAQAEGVAAEFRMNAAEFARGRAVPPPSFRDGFRAAWSDLHGPERWRKNPEVWVLDLRVLP